MTAESTTSGSTNGARVVAVIPARGGSKQVPRKNVLAVGGVPLVVRAVRAARLSALVDRVIVSTDDAEIARLALDAGAEIIERPDDLSGDTSTSESALLHVLDELERFGELPEVLVFLQATSPFIDPLDVDAAVHRVLIGSEDVVLAAVETFEFLWERSPAGALAVNHDATHRPRRQDREPHFRETGAFYVLRVDGFREARHRFFGTIGVEAVRDAASIEIDSLEQLEVARAIAPLVERADAEAGAIDVDAVVTDFDGVHTDDLALIDVAGNEQVTVSRSDGMGIRLLREAGIPVLILSTERHPIVAARAAKLGVSVLHGVDDKLAALTTWAADAGVPLDRIAYVGNDVNDLACLRAVGWPVVVPDAHQDARAAARVVLDHSGGHGAVRELAERVLRSRTKGTP